MITQEFKASLLEYLQQEKDFIEQDIEQHANLSDEQKEQDGYLIRNAQVLTAWGENCYDLTATINNTRLRPGDKVMVRNTKRKIEARVIENGLDILSIATDTQLVVGEIYQIEIVEAYLLDPLHTVLENCSPGTPGFGFISQLSKQEGVVSEGPFKFSDHTIARYNTGMNIGQWDCCRMIANNPSICCLQGPPGTGKTHTLAEAVNIVSSQGQQVLVIALTHQAVNNALNQIHRINSALPIIKVGDAAKAIKLDSSIKVFPSMRAYSNSLTTTKRNGDKKRIRSPQCLVIGMTFHAALVNFGLQHPRCVIPTYLFLDEASQIPLPYASVLGTFGAGSICLFGDSKQMPPIFRPELEENELSISILDYCAKVINTPQVALDTTYRMNEEITRYVSSHFYEPEIVLQSSEYSANRLFANVAPLRVEKNNIHHEHLLQEQSIIRASYDDMLANHATDYNAHEAKEAAEYVGAALELGLTIEDVAVITPYRAQVKLIRQYVIDKFTALGLDASHLPLIDTVERLQGQDVELIIMSMCTTDEKYFEQNKDFLLNPNRLNVMISRAKSKVVIISSKDRYVFN